MKEVVMEGVQPIVDALAEYEEINQKFGLPEYYEDQGRDRNYLCIFCWSSRNH